LPRNFDSDFYKRMSATVQTFLRRMVPLGYIYESEVFEKDERIMYPLLVYSALPEIFTKQSDGVFYWDFRDDPIRQSFVLSEGCKSNLRQVLNEFRPEIPSDVQKRYEVSDVDTMVHMMAAPKMPMKTEIVNFLNLCDLEFSILRGVVKSAKLLHQFQDENDPSKKLEALANFGSEFTETFNEDLGGDYAGKSLRPLGSLLILEIAKLLDPDLKDVKPTAMLETMVVNPAVEFNGGSLLDGKVTLKEEDLLLHQRILSA